MEKLSFRSSKRQISACSRANRPSKGRTLASAVSPSRHRSPSPSGISSVAGAREDFSVTTLHRSYMPLHVKDQIDLTEKENQIFDFLIQVLRHFNLQTQLRVAGGWVRDKLLGIECCDVDIAVDNMLGSEFCEKVSEYLSSTAKEMTRFCIMKCNPDRSKHLETARMRLFDMQIDFVNLRSEQYNENSRIPTMVFGSPLEDACRRDLTINSLFYNIHTRSIEDFTQQGIADLKSGKIVTPLPPKQTFMDDPLRVLRAIRFGFEMDQELKMAAACDDVKAAFADKICRERIGGEINLMLYGNQPYRAMAYIAEWQLFWTVFNLPPKIDTATWEGCERLSVAYVDSAWRLLQPVERFPVSDDHRRLCLYAALLLPFRNAVCDDEKGKKASCKQCPVVSYILCTSLKLKDGDAETVVGMHAAIGKFVSLISSIISYEDEILRVDWEEETIGFPDALKLIRIRTGLLLREIKDFWHAALVLGLLLYPSDIVCSNNLSNKVAELDERRQLFVRVEKAILKMGLENVWIVKPLNGNYIMSILQLKSGPELGKWKEKLFKWQLAHPSRSSTKCIEWMKQNSLETCANILAAYDVSI